MRSVPSIARWLLQHFGSSPNNDAIMGDIAEQYAQGRSRIWYWQQVVTAIAISMIRECWNHKLLAGQALVRGWLGLYLCSYLGRLFGNLASWSRWLACRLDPSAGLHTIVASLSFSDRLSGGPC